MASRWVSKKLAPCFSNRWQKTPQGESSKEKKWLWLQSISTSVEKTYKPSMNSAISVNTSQEISHLPEKSKYDWQKHPRPSTCFGMSYGTGKQSRQWHVFASSVRVSFPSYYTAVKCGRWQTRWNRDNVLSTIGVYVQSLVSILVIGCPMRNCWSSRDSQVLQISWGEIGSGGSATQTAWSIMMEHPRLSRKWCSRTILDRSGLDMLVFENGGKIQSAMI